VPKFAELNFSGRRGGKYITVMIHVCIFVIK